MKHGMKIGKKKPTRFYSWLNGTVFHKAMAEMKISHDDKRVVECVDHKLKKKEKPFFKAPTSPKRTQRGK
jgi:hypothetical protein